MPWFSYHSGHSGEFCRHAKGELLPVVEAAIARGFTHYGLSEHCPRDRMQDLYPDEHALGPDGLASAFAAYTDKAMALRERFADRIELLVGFETERLPPDSWAARMTALRASAPFDYVVGSVHDVDGTWVDYKPEITAQLADQLGGRDVLHARYFEALIELVQTLRPEIVGHLDLVRKFDGPSASFSPASSARLPDGHRRHARRRQSRRPRRRRRARRLSGGDRRRRLPRGELPGAAGRSRHAPQRRVGRRAPRHSRESPAAKTRTPEPTGPGVLEP